jgi:hypothetical protein
MTNAQEPKGIKFSSPALETSPGIIMGWENAALLLFLNYQASSTIAPMVSHGCIPGEERFCKNFHTQISLEAKFTFS